MIKKTAIDIYNPCKGELNLGYRVTMLGIKPPFLFLALGRCGVDGCATGVKNNRFQ
jgi:hypothetical protein